MKKIILPIIAALLILPAVAFAAVFQAEEEIYVQEDVINDDAYLAAGLVDVSQDVNGDLMVAGGQVTINASIAEDLTLGGGDISVNGEVGDDLRIGGGNVSVNAKITDDLLIGGGNVTLNTDIGGDLFFGAGNLIINGKVEGDITGGAGNVSINGEIKGDVNLLDAEKIILGPNAKITGNFNYRAPEELEIAEGIVGGEISYKGDSIIPKEEMKWGAGGFLAGFSVYRLLSLLLFGLLFIWFCRYYIFHSVEEGYENPFRNMGIGFLILIATPVAALIFAVTIIGLPIGLILALSYILLIYFAKVLVSMLIGWKIIKVKEKSSFWRLYGGFALGALIYTILCFIPVIGWILKFLLLLIAIGAMTNHEYALFKRLRNKKLV